MLEYVTHEMASVCTLIDQYLEESDSMVSVPVRRTAEKKGKLLRPMLLCLTARCGQYDQSAAIRVAASLELMHIASLIHDDIVDDGMIRRGTVTVQSEFGKDVAVYAGDFTLAKSIQILTSLSDLKLITLFNEAMTNVCRGEIQQHMSRYRHLSVEEYIEIVSHKTGELFALSLEAGGYIGGMDPDTCATLNNIGRMFGIAYQIYDDCLDYTASGQNAKKDTHKDMAQGSYTLPLLCALENDTEGSLKSLLESSLSDDDIYRIYDFVRTLGGPEKAMAYAVHYFNRVSKDLNTLSLNNNMDMDILVEGIDSIILKTRDVAEYTTRLARQSKMVVV